MEKEMLIKSKKTDENVVMMEGKVIGRIAKLPINPYEIQSSSISMDVEYEADTLMIMEENIVPKMSDNESKYHTHLKTLQNKVFDKTVYIDIEGVNIKREILLHDTDTTHHYNISDSENMTDKLTIEYENFVQEDDDSNNFEEYENEGLPLV